MLMTCLRSHQRRQDSLDPWPNYLGLHQTSGQWKIVSAHFSAIPRLSENRARAYGRLEAHHDFNNPLADNSPTTRTKALFYAPLGRSPALKTWSSGTKTWI